MIAGNEHSRVTFTLPLPLGGEKRMLYLELSPPGPEDPDEEDWRCALLLAARPTGKPPDHVSKLWNRLGDLGETVAKLTRLLRLEPGPVASYSMRARLPRADYPSVVVPRVPAGPTEVPPGLSALGAVELEQVGYRFPSGGAYGVNEVVLVYLHDADLYELTVRATNPIELAADVDNPLPLADKVGRYVLGRVFPSGGADAG